jgi:hypothetical protein
VASWSTNDYVKYYSRGGLDAWPATSYLNLWVCNLSGGVLGYAQFPGGAAATDGVVLLYSSVGSMLSPTAGAPYNLGRTATHEVGHWLNLYHIWGDDGTACTGSDNCSDTPNQAGENYGCPAYPKTDGCTSASPGVMFMNYMDYTDDNCMNMFTAGQSTRMNALFASGGSRVGLLSSLGCVAPSGCPAPTAATISNVSGTGATITWTAATGATSYTLQYCVSGTTTCTSTTTTGTSVTLSGLTGGTTYTYSVTSTCSTGTSTALTGTFSTFATSCGNPTSLTAGSVTSSGATLSWGAVSGALSYNLQYKTSASTTWTTINTTATSRVLTGLTANTIYNWQVQAVCNGLSGTYVAGTNFTTLAAASCGNPTGLVAGSITSSGATLTWTAVTGAASYNVQYKTSTATTWTTTTSTTASKSITGLSAGTVYNWQVQAVCTGASSSYVAGANFTTLASTTCTDTYESNNTSTTSKTISTNTDIRALISSTSDVDWFQFSTVAPNTNINITLTTLPADYDLTLYNSNASSILATSANAGTTSESIIRNTTAAATYKIKVFPYSGSSTTTCYTLRVNVGSTAFRLFEDGSFDNLADNVDMNSFVLYPNPAFNEVNITYNAIEEGKISVNLYDMVGKQSLNQVMNVNGGYNKFSLDVSTLSKGIYFVEVLHNNERTIKKLVIER